MYEVLKFVHILGVILLVGNVTVSAVWKVFANRTRNPTVIAFAQTLVTYTDWWLTLGGVALIMVGGYGMVFLGRLNLLEGWLLWGQVFFAASGAVWLMRLVPLQIAQSRITHQFHDEDVSPKYWALCRKWIFWGAVATLPLVLSTYAMVAKF